jgi:hypothetical protein
MFLEQRYRTRLMTYSTRTISDLIIHPISKSHIRVVYGTLIEKRSGHPALRSGHEQEHSP